jgi:hypothetical protein
LAGSGTWAPQAGDGGGQWTLRGLIAAHKLASLAVAATAAVVVAMFLAAALGPTGGAITDTTSCTQWGSSDQNLQTAYAQRYLREPGALAAAGRSPATVIAAINNGCMQAFGEDVADTTSVVQAISGNF